jgi:hypothetical protein
MLAPFWWVEREVCGDTDKSLAHLRSKPSTLTPAGVVPLLGGVTEVCQHSFCSFSGLVDSPGKIFLGREWDRHDDGDILDVIMALLGASRLET